MSTHSSYSTASILTNDLSLQFCREFLALNVYVALCYYKLDYYDVSQEVLAVYLQSIPDSTIALNLKACNHFRLYNGKAAEVSYTAMFSSMHRITVDDYDPQDNINFTLLFKSLW